MNEERHRHEDEGQEAPPVLRLSFLFGKQNRRQPPFREAPRRPTRAAGPRVSSVEWLSGVEKRRDLSSQTLVAPFLKLPTTAGDMAELC